MPSSQLWTRDFLIVSGVNFLLTLVFYLLIVLVGDYAVREYGATLSQAGLVAGIFIIGTLAGRLGIGQLIDTVSLRATLLVGMAAFVLTTGLYFLADSIAALVAVRFAQGVALGIANTATGTAVAHIIPSGRKAEGIGYFSLSTVLAAAVGPFLGLWMTQQLSDGWIFAFSLAVAIAGLLAATWLHPPERRMQDAGKTRLRFSPANLLEARAAPIATVILLGGLCYASVLAFITPYAIELKLVGPASLFFVVYSVAVLCSRPFTGRLLDRRGPGLVIYPCCLLMAAGLLLLASAHSGTALLLAGALIGLGYGNLQSAIQALSIMAVEPHRMGLATSTFYIFLDAGLGFGPYLLGLLAAPLGYRYLYASMAVLAVFCIGVFYLLYGRHVRSLSRETAGA